MRPRSSSPFRRLALVVSAALCLVGTARAAEPTLRFGSAFPVSEAMAERVQFWVRIFTEVSNTEAVLHDRNDVGLVYDVIPLAPGGGFAPVEAARASYDRLLTSMALAERCDLLEMPSMERLRLRALFAARGGAAGYARAIGQIRAQRGLREVFADGLARSQLYLPAIRRIFAATGLPAELAYLPHVESSFNPNAVSRAGAAGLWQFTRATADRHFDVDDGRDERFDPVQSSEAAARQLARAREVLGSWPLAVASYNHGVAGMARARAAVGSDSLDDIIRGYESPSFGFASRNFYAEFLAAVHVARHAAYYFPDLRLMPTAQYVVRSGDSLWTIARKHRVSIRSLLVANNLDGRRLRKGQLIVIRPS